MVAGADGNGPSSETTAQPNDPSMDQSIVRIGVARIWFGAVNYTENGSHEWSLHFDDSGWGSRTPSVTTPFSAGLVGTNGYGSGWEGVLEISAVPEPGTMLLFGSGLIGLVGFRRKFKKS